MAAGAPGFTDIPCQKYGKAETFYFCSHYQNLVELNPPVKNPNIFQDHTSGSAILLNMQLISNITNLPGNIAFLWLYVHLQSYNICILLLLSSWVPVVLCSCHLCSHKKRRNLFFREKKMYAVFSVRDWAINLVTNTGGFASMWISEGYKLLM